ncbi:MAG TPA: DUF4976 domain-containing protein, partial [Chitinophagaceae bacterium]|nr:DUF4976 domain-containing protein [Chitinophagaceae bacterium]HNJ56900.1 DUF4976 domain-containing protein [Chitinophagaceae bacterium]
RYKLIRFYKRVNSWELYDMKTDKQEMNNLYGNKKYKRIQSRMKRELLKLTAQYDDREARDMIVNDKLKN